MQKPVRIPAAFWPRVQDAMDFDGITSFSQFALASITQRVRRLELQKAAEEKIGSP